MKLKTLGTISVWVVVITLIGGAALTYQRWLPSAKAFFVSLQRPQPEPIGHSDDHEDDAQTDDGHAHEPDGHSHGPDDHAGEDEIELSPTALKNIGLSRGVVSLSDFQKTTLVPAIVAERAGHSTNEIISHLPGVVSHVFVLEGQLVNPGDPLFELRLTHEDVVTSQGEFLNALQAVDNAQRELNRLNSIGEDVIPGRRLIEQKYALDTAKTRLDAIRQTLRLHHIDEEEIDQIENSRRLLKTTTIRVPEYSDDSQKRHQFHVQSINVIRGQSIGDGEMLCILADHSQLYVEGQAFEEDADWLITASQEGHGIQALFNSDQDHSEVELQVLYVADRVDSKSRALRFYLLLPNQMLNTTKTHGPQFAAWKYRPGQRLQVKIPAGEMFRDQIVLPPDAVAIDGPNAFVFVQHIDHFARVDVHVMHRDKSAVVVERDEQLLGKTIAMSGAYQMHLAIKNASGGGVDPHAGHSHD